MINSVYRVVEVVLNKNGRGVITPDRFNDLAEQVQLKICSELPKEIELMQNRIASGKSGIAIKYLREALDKFYEEKELVRSTSSPYYFGLPDNCGNIENVYYLNREVEGIDLQRLRKIEGTRVSVPTLTYPVYAQKGDTILVRPESIAAVTLYFRRRLSAPAWTYFELNGKPVFNEADPAYNDFELGEHFQHRITVDMLTLLGLHLKEAEVIQVSQQAQNTDFQKEVITT
jgi:hypothetical protein